MRLHIDGNLVSEMKLSSLCEDHKYRDDLKRITLVGNDEKLVGYVYNIHVLPLSTTIKQQYEKVRGKTSNQYIVFVYRVSFVMLLREYDQTIY